jgi:hypothetical protein
MVGAASPASAFSYTLTHHVHNPFDPCATGCAIKLGTFLSATDAREATQNAINNTILTLRTFSFMDFSIGSRDVDAWTRELVTISKFDGKEGVLSRFVVEKGVTGVCKREDVAVEQPENAAVVCLPPGDMGLKIETDREKACSHHYSAFEEERAASWAQSRMPHFRRDEGPFRDVRNDTDGQGIMDQEERQRRVEQKYGQGKEQEQEQEQGHDETNEDAGAAQHPKGTKEEDADEYEGKQLPFSS